jgi:Sulfotransferase family
MSCYLFLLCPPYSGSTLLWKLLSTSNSVSSLPDEGQFLPEVETMMRSNPWDPKRSLPWPEIKAIWESYWDLSKPVLLEKSPPNLIRALDIRTHFAPVKFIVMVRNPYAHSEGLMRRNNWSVNRAAHFSAMCLRTQLRNARELEDVLVLTYESLVQDPAKACQQLAVFMPALADVDRHASFQVHSIDGTIDRPITELNTKKIASLSPQTIASMNGVFEQYRETIEAWGYEFLAPEVTRDPTVA